MTDEAPDNEQQNTEPMASAAESVETSLDLLANIALLTITALRRVIQNRGPEGWTQQHEMQLGRVKADIEKATGAVDRWMDDRAGDEGALDLSKLQAKLASINRTLEQWPVLPPS